MSKSGWLIKEGGRYKTWKKRWCVIDNGYICYYRKENKKEKCGDVNLRVASTIQSVDYKGKKNCFEIVTPDRVFHMSAESSSERDLWIENLIKRRDELIGSHKVQPKAPNTPSAGLTKTLSQKKVTSADFDLLKVIGKGSFGKVIQVRKKDNGKIYAMKVLNKQVIIDRNEVDHTKAEKEILMKLDHPFLVKLHYSFQDEENLFIIMDYINGGELFFHLQKDKCFSEERVRFYAAEIASGIEYLHKSGVIYRDLKPENLLLGRDGHIIMTDFGLSKQGIFEAMKTETFCGTPEYLAPEVLEGNPYSNSVDWWSFGTLIYEMLNGLPPFYNEDTQVMYTKILSEELKLPSRMSSSVRDLLKRLLDKNPSTRLQDPEEIRRHPFFAAIDWDALLKKSITPPFVPEVKNEYDTNNIDPSFTMESPSLQSDDCPKYSRDKNAVKTFEGFTYNPNK